MAPRQFFLFPLRRFLGWIDPARWFLLLDPEMWNGLDRPVLRSLSIPSVALFVGDSVDPFAPTGAPPRLIFRGFALVPFAERPTDFDGSTVPDDLLQIADSDLQPFERFDRHLVFAVLQASDSDHELRLGAEHYEPWRVDWFVAALFGGSAGF